MKTKILAVTEVPPSFKRDAPILPELSEEQWTSAKRWLSAHLNVFDTGLREAEILELSRQTGLPAARLSPLFRCLFFFRYLLAQHGDTPADLASDLLSEKVIDQTASDRLVSFFSEISTRLSAAVPVQAAYEVVLPVYQDARTRCLLLPKFEREYDLRDPVDQYACAVSALLPSVVIYIDLDGPGDQKDPSFVLTENGLDELISRLQFAKKQLEAVKAHVKV